MRNFAAATLMSGTAAAATYGGLVEPFNYELTETNIFLKNLPAGFDDFRILHISDVHHSSLVSLDEVERVVKLAASIKADLIALTGDYATSDRRYVEPCTEALGELSAPHGVWAVLGNHDHYIGAEFTISALTRAKIEVLHNANTIIRRGAETLQLAGVGDSSWVGADWAKARQNLNAKHPSILLTHQPVDFDLPGAQDFSLVLSGHTHGGQVALPLIGAPARFMDQFRYISGLFKRSGRQLYVTRGTGMIGLPVRFGARPEISVLRLRKLK